MVPDQWRFHTGAVTDAQRRRLLRFMSRRSWWAALHHGWQAAPGKAALLAAAVGASVGWVFGTLGWVVAPMIGVAFTVVVVVPLAHGIARTLFWWHLRRPGTRVVHWCEGPNGELAVRMTTPRPACAGVPEHWYGMDLYGVGGAGRRLLTWLQHLVDERGAILIIRTTHPPLVGYYQQAGFAVGHQPRIRLGRWAQLGATVLHYPPDAPWRPVHRQRAARLREHGKPES